MPAKFAFSPVAHQFLARFTLIFFFTQLALILFPLTGVQNSVAQLIGEWTHVEYSHSLLYTVNGWFDVTPFCLGLTTLSILAGMVFGFTYPSLRKRIAFFIGAGAALLILNLFRIVFVVEIGKRWGIGAADALHTFTWFVFTALAVLAWILFLMRERKTTSVMEISRFLQSNK